MTIYKLQERYWVGMSIGYYALRTLETFEDLELAEKERENLKRSGFGSGCFYIKTETQPTTDS